MTTTTLPPIPFWETRSFWLALATAAQVIAPRFGVEITSPGTVADTIVAILPAITGIWAYIERAAPQRSVVLW